MERGGTLSGLLVLLVALAANAWMLRLEFQGDDFDLIPDAGWMLGVEPRPAAAPALADRTYSFRPTLWVVLWGLLELSGGHAVPWVFHGFFWCGHAAAAWLVHRLVRVRCGEVAGVVSGILFAILPGGIQAASWVSAGGDQLAVLFVLLGAAASDRVLRTGSVLGVVMTGAAAFCAVCSKETAVVLVPAIVIPLFSPPPGASSVGRRRIAVCLAIAAGIVAAWIVRAFALVRLTADYSIATQLLPSQLAILPAALRGFLMPWSPGPAGEPVPASVLLLRLLGIDDRGVSSVLTVVGVLAALIPLFLGFASAPPRRRLAMIVLAASLVAVTVPVLPMIARDGFGMQRARYPASLLFSALVGASLSGVTPREWWRIAAIAPFVLLSADQLVAMARVELNAAAVIRAARAELHGIVSSGSGTRFLVLEPPSFVGGVPFLTSGFAKAASPPFGDVSERPLVWPNLETFKRSPAMSGEPSPIQFLAWDGRQITRRGPALAAIPRDLPALEPDRAAPGTFRPASSVPPRGIVGIGIDAAASGSAPIGVVTWSARDQVRKSEFDASGAGARIVSIPDEAFDESWFREPALDAVRIEGVTLDRPPVLLRAMPVITVKAPARGETLDFMSAPRISFASAVPAAAFRATIEVVILGARAPLAVCSVDAPDLLREADGTHVIAMDQRIRIPGAPQDQSMDWPAVAALIVPHAGDPRFRVPIEIRIEALDGSRMNAIARSDWLPAALARAPAGR